MGTKSKHEPPEEEQDQWRADAERTMEERTQELERKLQDPANRRALERAKEAENLFYKKQYNGSGVAQGN